MAKKESVSLGGLFFLELRSVPSRGSVGRTPVRSHGHQDHLGHVLSLVLEVGNARVGLPSSVGQEVVRCPNSMLLF